MRGRRRGLTELFFEQKSVEESISTWEGDTLQLLPLGRKMDRKRRKAFPERFLAEAPAILRNYPNVLIELPAADDRKLEELASLDGLDAVLLLIDPRQVSRRKAKQAADRLRKRGVALVGSLADVSGSGGGAQRMNRLARQLLR